MATRSSAFAVSPVECAGKSDASHALIYLHGVDPVEPSEQERGNRQLLKNLANSEGVALAMLRSTTLCSQPAFRGKLCWPRSTDEVIKEEFARILAQAAKCYKPSATLGMVGFSNGGFFLNKLVTQCTPGRVRWFLSIGSGGSVAGAKAGSACGHLHLLIGRKDLTHREAQRLYKDLQKLGRSIEFSEFDGGHVIPEDATRDAVRAFKKRRSGI